MIISMIVAADEHNLIGQENDLPWKLPMDMKYFKNQTWGMPTLMGRNTFESMGGRLPGRKCIVITRDKNWSRPGVETVHDFPEAIAYAEQVLKVNEFFVIGGMQVYTQAMEFADRIYITRVHHVFDGGDAWFPEIRQGGWVKVRERHTPADAKNAWPMSFQVWERENVPSAGGGHARHKDTKE